MRLCFVAAIAVPLLSLFALSAASQGASPTANTVVDVEVVPAPPSRQKLPLPSVPAPPLLPFGSFNSPQLDRQLQRYSAYVEQYGVPDILIVGSSRALQGIDPVILQQALTVPGGSSLRVYNFGINGATAQVVNWVLRDLFPAEHRPRLILWADGSRAFNSGRIDQTFQRIVTSPGHQQLRAGDLPPLAFPQPTKLGQVCMDGLSMPLAPPVKSRSLAPRPTAPARSLGVECQRPLKLVIQQAANHLAPPPPRPSAAALGFQVVTAQFNPSQYFQRFPRVAGNFDGDYRNFNLGGVQRTAMVQVSRWANSQQIPLVLVNLPLTTTYLDASRRFYDRQFRAQMQRLAVSQSFTFIDLAEVSELTRNEYFADPSHLNQAGAIAVATHLGAVLNQLDSVSRLSAQTSLPARPLTQRLPWSDLTLQLISGRR